MLSNVSKGGRLAAGPPPALHCERRHTRRMRCRGNYGMDVIASGSAAEARGNPHFQSYSTAVR
jgi:hypothetical protein